MLTEYVMAEPCTKTIDEMLRDLDLLRNAVKEARSMITASQRAIVDTEQLIDRLDAMLSRFYERQ